MQKIRFVSKNNDANIGLNQREIDLIQIKTLVDFPKIYTEFLKIAGNRSNALGTHLLSFDSLIELQKEFKTEIEKSDFFENNLNLWCFLKSNSNKYYFFYLNKEQNPMVYCFSKINIPMYNGWSEKFGPIDKQTDFVEFIKWKTDKKFGMNTGEIIKKSTLLILSLPFLIPFLIYLKIKTSK